MLAVQTRICHNEKTQLRVDKAMPKMMAAQKSSGRKIQNPQSAQMTMSAHRNMSGIQIKSNPQILQRGSMFSRMMPAPAQPMRSIQTSAILNPQMSKTSNMTIASVNPKVSRGPIQKISALNPNVLRPSSSIFGSTQTRSQRSQALTSTNALSKSSQQLSSGFEPVSAGWGSYKDESMIIMKRRGTVITQAKAGEVDSMVPDMPKRTVMNALLVGALGLPGTSLVGGFAYFFVPPSAGGGGGGQTAKDALGDDVTVQKWLKTHQDNDRQLVQGLKGDATYLITTTTGVENFGVNAVCTHLGCVVPWNKANNKFMCPCHGSQYDANGKVVRGPAPLSLALAHVNIDDNDKVIFSPWTETDFRTGLAPWWK